MCVCVEREKWLIHECVWVFACLYKERDCICGTSLSLNLFLLHKCQQSSFQV